MKRDIYGMPVKDQWGSNVEEDPDESPPSRPSRLPLWLWDPRDGPISTIPLWVWLIILLGVAGNLLGWFGDWDWAEVAANNH